ncbi:MAG: hypothetical protein ACQEUM_07065 [Pseudomonadota bacterium]
MTSQWARHADAIEDARDNRDTTTISRAVRWAVSNDQPEATDLYTALAAEFYAQGNSNAASCETNRAIEIIIDAYLEQRAGRTAA